jgi:hypothetical protein
VNFIFDFKKKNSMNQPTPQFGFLKLEASSKGDGDIEVHRKFNK